MTVADKIKDFAKRYPGIPLALVGCWAFAGIVCFALLCQFFANLKVQ